MCKPNDKHWEVIFRFFDIYPEMATGRINAENGKQRMRKLWEELSQQLNCLGYGTKSPDKWQKTWIDFKYNLKKKASNIKTDQAKTGGGPAGCKVLNEFELRALEFLGHGFIHGVGSVEVGFTERIKENATPESLSPSLLSWPPSKKKIYIQNIKNYVPKDQDNSQTQIASESMLNNYQSTYRYQVCSDNDVQDTANIPKTHKTSQSQSFLSFVNDPSRYNHYSEENLEEDTTPSSFKIPLDSDESKKALCGTSIYKLDINKETKRTQKNINKRENSTPTTASSLASTKLDHTYVGPAKKTKKNEDSEYANMYAQTISVLKEINNTVDKRLGQIYDVLNERLPQPQP